MCGTAFPSVQELEDSITANHKAACESDSLKIIPEPIYRLFHRVRQKSESTRSKVHCHKSQYSPDQLFQHPRAKAHSHNLLSRLVLLRSKSCSILIYSEVDTKKFTVRKMPKRTPCIKGEILGRTERNRLLAIIVRTKTSGLIFRTFAASDNQLDI